MKKVIIKIAGQIKMRLEMDSIIPSTIRSRSVVSSSSLCRNVSIGYLALYGFQAIIFGINSLGLAWQLGTLA